MVAKRGLGKGLDSMIPDRGQRIKKETAKVEEENVSRETLIGINEIEPNKSQPRKVFDEDTLQELADSIKQYGIIQPLVVQKKGELYEIIAGERRWRAARMAGLKKIPVIIKLDNFLYLFISHADYIHYNASAKYITMQQFTANNSAQVHF